MNKTKQKWPLRSLAIMVMALLLGSCATMQTSEEMPAEDLAKKGLEQYRVGKYFLAADTFTTLKNRFPFSRFSLLAELKSADSYYYMKEYDKSLELYKSFEENHPTNEAIPYVIFQIGRCQYNSLDTVDRETTGAHDSIKSFARLLRTHPNTPYTQEAEALIIKATNFLAAHELYVAEYYF
ncbi:MAG: outer membrane protein assembly factor BamD, partial [Thermodesulfobacteriota bacterium]